MQPSARPVPVAIAALVFSLVGQPWPSTAATASLGTARGVRGAEMRLDGGGRWLPLGGRALPVMSGARIRSTTGAVSVDLAGGGRLTLMPFSGVRFEATSAVLDYGRLALRLPAASRLAVTAGEATLQPAPGRAASAEVVSARDLVAVRVLDGALAALDARGTARVVEAGASPLVLSGGSPVVAATLFTGGAPAAAPAGARAAYTPAGENVGYVGPDGQLVVHPGFARDLTGPFPEEAVRRALARVPPGAREGAVPLLDVHGDYLGYVAGPSFFALTGAAVPAAAAGPPPQAPPAGSTSGQSLPEPEISGWRWHYTVGLLALVGGTVAGVLIAADDDEPASPVAP